MKTEWIFLRGLGRESGHWGSFVKDFSNAMGGEKLHCLDFPGNGKFFKRKSPTTIGEIVEALRKDLPKNFSPKYLFALSLGSLVALEWALKYPKEIKALVLVNPPSVRELTAFYKRLRPSAFIKLRKCLYIRTLEKREALILDTVSNQKQNHANILKQWVLIQKKHPVSRKNILRQLVAATRYKLLNPKTDIPILILNGSKDQLVNPSCSVALSRYLKCSLNQHPTAGHDLPIDDPQWTIKSVLTWMKFPNHE